MESKEKQNRKDVRKGNISGYMDWARSLGRFSPETRLRQIMQYYADGAPIQCIRTLMCMSRRGVEDLLQKAEKRGEVTMLYLVDTQEALDTARFRERNALLRSVKSKRWIRSRYLPEAAHATA